MDIYTNNALNCSKITTKNYSTSFSMGVAMLPKRFRWAIYAIYGFVRFADEIVDTFSNVNSKTLLNDFIRDTWWAIDNKTSTNPILHSFQWAVNTYDIEHELIHAFLRSMEMDLTKKQHDKESYEHYIYGSAEVVGLMCLCVFYSQQKQEYKRLLTPARKLGEAFQKVNFLRDMKSDYNERGRVYFPQIDFNHFSELDKITIEQDIENDFKEAVSGIRQLHKDVRLGVFVAYKYYLALLKKIKHTSAIQLKTKRFRVSNFKKIMILLIAYLQHRMNTI